MSQDYYVDGPAIEDRKGDWIQTYSGKSVWPLDAREDEIEIQDIAHALSLICRYTGHVRDFFSVAQHSIIASWIVPKEDAMWGLLHDASEAYICDLARPVKYQIPEYRQIEKNLMKVICRKFKLPEKEPESIKHADMVLLATEHRDLMGPPHIHWPSLDGVRPLDTVIQPLAPKYVEVLFLERFYELLGFNA